jgi:hypothetical protein
VREGLRGNKFQSLCVTSIPPARRNFTPSFTAYNQFKFYSELYTVYYFQPLYPFAWKHPAHTLLPFVNLHVQEAFEQQMGLQIGPCFPSAEMAQVNAFG